MANDLNRICLIGRLGKDAEISETKTGKQYMKFTMATNRSMGKEEKTEWHNITVWNEKLVENLHVYLTKGKQIYLEGLATSWKKDENSTIPFVEVSYGHNIQLLGSRDEQNVESREDKSVFGKPAIREAEAQTDAKAEQDDGVPW